MLYQLSYSRSMTYGWWGLRGSNQVSIQDAVNSRHDSTQRVYTEIDVHHRSVPDEHLCGPRRRFIANHLNHC